MGSGRAPRLLGLRPSDQRGDRLSGLQPSVRGSGAPPRTGKASGPPAQMWPQLEARVCPADYKLAPKTQPLAGLHEEESSEPRPARRGPAGSAPAPSSWESKPSPCPHRLWSQGTKPDDPGDGPPLHLRAQGFLQEWALHGGDRSPRAQGPLWAVALCLIQTGRPRHGGQRPVFVEQREGEGRCCPHPQGPTSPLNLREVRGHCDHHAGEPRHAQRRLRPLSRQGLVLGQRDAPGGPAPGLQGHRLPAHAQHQGHRCEWGRARQGPAGGRRPRLAQESRLARLPHTWEGSQPIRGSAVGAGGHCGTSLWRGPRVNPQVATTTPREQAPGITL